MGALHLDVFDQPAKELLSNGLPLSAFGSGFPSSGTSSILSRIF